MAADCAEPIQQTDKGTGVNSYRDIACQYCVEDLPGADRPGARLQKILDALQSGNPVTRLALEFLQRQDLEALHRLATGVLSYDRFRELALAEQSDRVAAAAIAKREREAEARARIAEKRVQEAALRARREEAQKKAEVEQLARESDPKYIAKQINRALCDRYRIHGFVEQRCIGRLMKILKTVDAGQRLSESDFVWLSTVAEAYFSNVLRSAYHLLEAAFFASEFKQKHDPWLAVNASSHYRKAGYANRAISLLSTVKLDKVKSAKLKSALCTTHGGAMRDLDRWDEALSLGEQAHELRSDDYRPCTLLGAIYMETGHYSLGQAWYAKAEERGAPTDHIDQELHHIFFHANKAKQEEMRAFLLNEDPRRYAWVNSKSKTPIRRN